MYDNELKSCPFCGESGKYNGPMTRRLWSRYEGTQYFVRCQDCYAMTAHVDTEEEAVELWNTRNDFENKENNEGLLPSPFSKLKDSKLSIMKFYINQNGWQFYVYCEETGFSGKYSPTKEIAIQEWNKRKD